MPKFRPLAAALLLCAGAAQADADQALRLALDHRLDGDASGACVAAAVIDGDRVARAWRCADPEQSSRIGPDAAFEIGSVAKTMTGALLADLIAQGRASLDDPLAAYLPEGTAVPDHSGQPILLRHLVAHTSGLPRLPPGMDLSDPADPYAALDVATLLAALQDTTLAQAPGERFEYSNFGYMLLSYALAHRAGEDLEALLRARLFAPLGMDGAYVATPPDGVRPAQGHLPGGEATPAWRFAPALAGVGGVRATLDDMVRYAQAQLGQAEAPIAAALVQAQQPIAGAAEQPMAMGWLLAPFDGRVLHLHEGGTGGFSAFVGFERARGRAVVLLSDTALYSHGGLEPLGLHLLDARIPAPGARRPAAAPMPAPEMLRAYAGIYPLAPGFELSVRERDGGLFAQATGQGEFALDATGEADRFEAAAYGIEIRFLRGADEAVTALELHQGGQTLHGEKR